MGGGAGGLLFCYEHGSFQQQFFGEGYGSIHGFDKLGCLNYWAQKHAGSKGFRTRHHIFCSSGVTHVMANPFLNLAVMTLDSTMKNPN